MTNSKLKFIHCADLHLDSPFSGVSEASPGLARVLREAAFNAFRNSVDLALQVGADFFLVSGDVYDSEDRSIRAQLFFVEQLKRLADAGIPSFVVHGNHDPLSGWELDRELPPLIHRFGREVESAPLVIRGERAGTVHGCSFPVRDVEENLALRFHGRRTDGVNIALLHCNVGGRKGHENYAPCSLDDLRASGMDYWALGHVHGAEVLCRSPLIVYPGNIQGRHIGETGEKGVFLATLDSGGSGPASGDVEFIPCDAVRWIRESLSIEGMERDEELLTAFENLVERARRESDGRPAIVRARVIGRGRLSALMRRPGFLSGPGGLVETLNQGEEGRGDFVHIEGVTDETSPPFDLEVLSAGSHFVGDFLQEARSFEEGGALRGRLMDLLADLGVRDKLHREVFDRVDGLSDDEISSLLRRGTILALEGLLEGEDDE
ncbi:MAG: DNA repair exonuclease [Synergistaceae bacterium]|nr:DNA repair exonuclease [Synergistota bacterium]NLM70736.1 DNA repair exonuclease [Synergistaceae bacterium]